jgi:uncharacterized membrane protein YfcA
MIGDGLSGELLAFACATLVASIVAGLAGFAFGLVSSAIWLHFISPQQSAVLIPAFALVAQSIATWRLRHAVRPKLMIPFIVGGAIGIPLGTEVLRYMTPAGMRTGLGAFMIVFVIYSLAKPTFGPIRSNAAIDGGVGVISGVVGALTGLAGLPVNIWTTARGMPKDEQRALFQPVAVVLFVFTLIWFGAAGVVPDGTLRLFLIGLPLVPLGTWIGLKLYGRLDDRAFRRLVLWLLLVSGLTLVPSAFLS